MGTYGSDGVLNLGYHNSYTESFKDILLNCVIKRAQQITR